MACWFPSGRKPGPAGRLDGEPSRKEAVGVPGVKVKRMQGFWWLMKTGTEEATRDCFEMNFTHTHLLWFVFSGAFVGPGLEAEAEGSRDCQIKYRSRNFPWVFCLPVPCCCFPTTPLPPAEAAAGFCPLCPPFISDGSALVALTSRPPSSFCLTSQNPFWCLCSLLPSAATPNHSPSFSMKMKLRKRGYLFSFQTFSQILMLVLILKWNVHFYGVFGGTHLLFIFFLSDSPLLLCLRFFKILGFFFGFMTSDSKAVFIYVILVRVVKQKYYSPLSKDSFKFVAEFRFAQNL